MRHQRNIFLIALLCSLCLHLASLVVYVGYDRLHGTGRAIASSANGATSQPAARAQQDEIIVYPDMGEDAGTGIGSNSSLGERPLQARQAEEDQALLSRDAEGSGRIGAPPSKWKGPTGDGSGGTPAVVATATPAPQPDATPAPTPAVHEPSPPVEKPSDAAPPEPVKPPVQPVDAPKVEPSQAAQAAPPPIDKRTEVAMVLPAPNVSASARQAQADSQMPVDVPKPAPAPTPPAAKPPTPTPPVAVAPRPETGDGRTRGLPIASADPLPQSDSDSDPFSRLSGSVIFHDGRLDVRMGRKIKTTRPQVRIAGQIDMIALNNPTVVLEVHIARTGNVTDVKIAHSSGSNQIDEPTRLAVYDWWFEPVKDKKGNPISDVIFFSVQFI
jgi:TonB family protein